MGNVYNELGNAHGDMLYPSTADNNLSFRPNK